MIRDSQIQLFLRGILLDGLENNDLSIPVLYENTKKKNYGDTYIVEQLVPLTETAYNDRCEEGSGIYKLTLFGNIGGGLAFTDTVDTIKELYKRNTYVLETEEGSNVSLSIDNTITNEILYENGSDKIQKSISIQYRKFKTI